MDNKPVENIENDESGGEPVIEKEKTNVENDVEPMCVDATDEGDAPPPENTGDENKIGVEGGDEDVQLEGDGDKVQEESEHHEDGSEINEVVDLPGKSTEEDGEKEDTVETHDKDKDDDEEDESEPKEAETSSSVQEKEGETNDMDELENPAEVDVNEDKATEDHGKSEQQFAALFFFLFMTIEKLCFSF